MFSFFTDLGFWAISLVFVVGLVVEIFISFSSQILKRRPNALLVNNIYIISLFAFLVYIFFARGFLQGIMVILMAFVAYVVMAKIINSRIETELFEKPVEKS